MTRFTKRPVTIEARQMPTDPSATTAIDDLYGWVEENTLGSFEPMAVIEGREPWPVSGVTIDPRDGRMVIATLEGGHWVDLGDWIIRGVAGEFYPCKPDIFAASYSEEVDVAELPEQDQAALARFTEPNFAVKDPRRTPAEEFRAHYYRAALAVILASEPTKSRTVALTELETAMMWGVKAFFGAPGE